MVVNLCKLLYDYDIDLSRKVELKTAVKLTLWSEQNQAGFNQHIFIEEAYFIFAGWTP